MTDSEGLNAVLREIAGRLGGIEAKLESLVGNGQPGRMASAEARLTGVERKLWAFSGAAAAIGFAARYVALKLGIR